MKKAMPREMENEEEFSINIPCSHNSKLEKVVEKVNESEELKALWRVQNVNAVDRKGYSDHGPVHMQIVANIALKIGRILFDNGEGPSLTTHYTGFKQEDAEIILVLSALLHDIGMTVHRYQHEKNALFIAKDFVDEILQDMYTPAQLAVIRSEILHAIYSHRSNSEPLTVEAGIIRVSDALDMEKGRSKITFENGRVDIHSVSAAAVDEVKIEEKGGKVSIKVILNSNAGIFQITGLLKNKLEGSGIEDQITVKAEMSSESGQVIEDIVI